MNYNIMVIFSDVPKMIVVKCFLNNPKMQEGPSPAIFHSNNLNPVFC